MQIFRWQIIVKYLCKVDLIAYWLTPWSSPSWEANRFSVSQEILRILWKAEVNYRV